MNCLDRTLHWAVDEVKLQDFFYPILGVSSSNPEGGALAWDFFKTNFAKVRMHVYYAQGIQKCFDCIAGAILVQIKAKVGSASPRMMTAAVTYSCNGLTSAKEIDEIEAFFKANPLPQSTRSISQMIEVRVSEVSHH